MRFKLLRRRLTISAPQLAVRTPIAWPLRWALAAVVLGFCAAIALWAFDFGKTIAGIDTGAKEEVVRLRAEVDRLKAERDKAQLIVNTSASLLTAEKASGQRLAAELKALESKNQQLRDDLAFFEKLMPASGDAIAIRGLSAEVLAGTQLKWQVLLIQPVKNPPVFKGKLEVTLAGTLGGKPWVMDVPAASQQLSFRQYRRVEGMVDLPAQAVVKNVSAKVLEGNVTRAVQSIQL